MTKSTIVYVPKGVFGSTALPDLQGKNYGGYDTELHTCVCGRVYSDRIEHEKTEAHRAAARG